MDVDSTKAPYKQPKRPAEPSEGQPEEVPELREISPELKHILEEHKKWVESEGQEGEQAILMEANLQKAHLIGANLQKADLYDADLTDVKNFTQAQLNEACVDERTKLPEGLTRPKPCPEEKLPKSNK